MKKELAALRATEPAGPLDMPIPERFRRAGDDRDVRVSWRWFQLSTLFTLFFAIAWDSFLVFWYARAIPDGDAIGILFPVCHVAVGIGVTYGALSGLFNRTTMRAHDGTLHVSHGPLPWRGNARLEGIEIRQLYVRRNEHTDSESGSKSWSYDVCALLTNGREKKLVRNLKEQSEAAYLEHVFEHALGITPARVPGEASS